MYSKNREFSTEVIVPARIEKVFDFFSDAKNLETITPPWLHFKVLSQSTTQIQEGTEFEYSLKLRGFPVRWKSRILKWKTNEQFVDMQLKGPYKKWEHLHLFKSHPDGTWMKDQVEYALPFGVLGDVFGGWYVDRDVRKIFEYRKKVILESFSKESP